jgi:hypothetical protein
MSLRAMVGLSVIAAAALAMAAAADTPSKDPAAGGEAKTFTIPLQKGDYVFVGLDTGNKGKTEREKGVQFLQRARIDPETQAAAWELQITFQPPKDDQGAKTFEGTVAWRYGDTSGVLRERISGDWHSVVPADKEVKAIPIEKDDASKEVGVEGLTYYRIPFAEVDGEKHGLVVAITQDKDLFAKAITVPKKFILFNWKNNWVTLKEALVVPAPRVP